MSATSPDEAILFAQFTGEEKSHRDAALAVLQSEILNHLKQRKLGMGLHDLENAAKHLIDQLQKPQTVAFSNWNEVRTHAFSEAVLRANEDKLWLAAYPQLHHETLKVLISNRYNLPEAELVAVTDDSILKVRELNPALVAKPDKLKRFLFTVAKNKALDQLKANGAAIRGGNKVGSIEELDPGKEIAEGDVEAQGFDVASGEKPPDKALLDKEKRHTLWQAICKMPKRHAQIFLDLHLHRMKHHEVAEKHGLKIGSIGVYNRRAIEMLTVILAGTLGMLMLMWNWTISINNQVQVAIMDPTSTSIKPVKVESGASAIAMLGGQTQTNRNLTLANDFKQTLQTESFMLYSNAGSMQNWSTNWLTHSDHRQFKVIYNAQEKMVHLVGYWNGSVQLNEQFAIVDEIRLPDVLKVVRQRIRQVGGN